MKKGELIALSNDQTRWIEEASFALGNRSYLKVHPSHILSLIKGAKSFEASEKQLKEVKEAVLKLELFIRGLEQ